MEDRLKANPPLGVWEISGHGLKWLRKNDPQARR